MSSTFNIPAGFVLVPREPTFEMNKAGQEAVWDFHPEDTIEGNEETARAAYWAMIAAAPTPTQVAEAPKAVPQVVVGEASKLDPLATAPIDSRWYIGPKSSLVEAVTKAIVFEDCGNTEDWRDNVNLGEAAIRVCDARNPPRCSYCHASTSVPVHALSDERISEIAAEIEALPNRGGRTHQFARAILVAALTPSPAPSAAPHQGGPTMEDALTAGDGTLRGAIDYWQGRALAAEAARDVDETNKVLADNYLRATAPHQGADALREALIVEMRAQINHLVNDLCDSTIDEFGLQRYVPKQTLMFHNMVAALVRWSESAALAQHQPQQGEAT